MEIIELVYGRSVFGENHIFFGGDGNKKRPIDFKICLVKTESRMILLDCGCVTMRGWDMQDFIGPVKALEKIGVDPLDITDVMITHAHHDHIECVGEYKNATVHIERRELEKAKKFFTDSMVLNVFDDKYSLDGVEMIRVGGHTDGSCIVKMGDTVFVGDACYLRENIEKQIPTGATQNLYESEAFIKEYKNYNLIFAHDK